MELGRVDGSEGRLGRNGDVLRFLVCIIRVSSGIRN